MFGWRKSTRWSKASKCKKLIEEFWGQLKIQRTRIDSIIRQSHSDIAQLLMNGQHQEGFAMVDQLSKDSCLASAYDQIGFFSVCIYTHLSSIRKNGELSAEVKEAVSSIIFAASRCDELPKLYSLQNLFKKLYGCEFVKANVELLPGNHVNDEMKQNLISAIAGDGLVHPVHEGYGLRVNMQHEEASYRCSEKCEVEPKKKASDLDTQFSSDKDAGRQVEVVEFKEIPKQITFYCSSTDSESRVTDLCEANTTATGLENEEKSSSGSESKCSYNIREIIYLDDIKEKLSTQENCGSKDELSSLKLWNESGSSGKPERKIATSPPFLFDRSSPTKDSCVSLSTEAKMFGWRKSTRWSKASKCKKLIEEFWGQLKIQRTRIDSIIRQSHSDIAQLLKNGQHQQGFAMVDQLSKDSCLASAYDQVGHFSVCVYTHLSTIRKDRELSAEVKEAVSSIIFAASRCDELPELYLLQNLFEELYGCEFVKANVELLPGNHVNDEMKKNLISAIAGDGLVHPVPEGDGLRFNLQHEEASYPCTDKCEVEPKKKASNLETHFNSDKDVGRQVEVVEFKEIPKQSTFYCSSSDSERWVTHLCESDSNSSSGSTTAVGSESEEKSSSGSTSEGSYNIHEIIYLDDIEEKLSTQENCNSKDELSSLKLWEECGNSGKPERKKNSAGRRLKRRSNRQRSQSHGSIPAWSSLSRKDLEYAMYYGLHSLEHHTFQPLITVTQKELMSERDSLAYGKMGENCNNIS